MNTNSLTVYYEKVKPNLTEKQSNIIAALVQMKQGTQYQVARYLGVFPNQISGRFSELVKKGILKIEGTIVIDSRPHSIYLIDIENELCDNSTRKG
jgi:predicted ArsR family transcriptional regulator